ncbi:DUF2231 domain-containing protein [Streptomyces cupreus]|uniref:DUF2231 domain-containing protein n=1 Tax=Streptomyces cupreus TaxID=2759956 RepID=A0A7X1MDY3_9ACTN|nr:DUF2231 domain-containing protein [Streptomyces cupreus]MBC2907418.1 hypothetical protein [Streptomyces cupreus]
MLDTLFGLPAHPLIVHATVVAVPAAALTIALAALWPQFRAWAGPLPLLLSLTALILVPVTVKSGESLARRVDETALTHRHSDLGHDLLPWTVALSVGAVALFWLSRREARPRRTERPATARLTAVALILLALTGATGSAMQIVRIGHSGAEAAWTEP